MSEEMSAKNGSRSVRKRAAKSILRRLSGVGVTPRRSTPMMSIPTRSPTDLTPLGENTLLADPTVRFGSRCQTCQRRPVPPYRTGRSSSCPFLLGVHARDWLSSSMGPQKEGQDQQGLAHTGRDGERAEAAEKQSWESNAMARGGSRPGAGRKRGRVGQAKRELAEMAKEHAEAALLTLVEVASGECAASARVTAS